MRISDWSSDVCSSDLESVQRRADAIGKEVAAARHVEVAEAGAQNAAVGQHDLEATDVLGAVAVGRMAEAAIEDVAHDTGVGAGPSAVRPQRDALGAQMLGELALDRKSTRLNSSH